MNVHDRFEQFDDDFLKFDRITNKKTNRPDLHAFLLLDEIFTEPHGIIQADEHDKIFLDIDEEKSSKLTDDQILEIVRCGVRYSEYDCLCMFV